ncbi:MAG: NUDIX hydrolase [Pseudomonadota bacterium]
MSDERGDDHLRWELLDSEPGPDLIIFSARYDRLRHPQTGLELRRIVLPSVDWINVVAIDRNGGCVMVRQYRFGAGEVTLETAGGMVDPGEEPLAAAQRELLEETGYGGGDWESLGSVQPNPAYHDNRCHHFLARNVERLQAPEPGAGEAIEVVLLSESDIIAAAHSGEIAHVLALSALARVYPLWPR